MVFSVMGLMGVELPVSRFGPNDRAKAMIALIQELTNQRGMSAEWLFIAPEMPPSEELSLLPAFPKTSESGRAEIPMPDGGSIPAFEAVGLLDSTWNTNGAPMGILDDEGYLRFQSKGALVIANDDPSMPPSIETWAVIIGKRREFNRNPATGQIEPYDPNDPWPEIVELTLMFVERYRRQDSKLVDNQVSRGVEEDELLGACEDAHGQRFHRIGMENRIDEKDTLNWTWVKREFCVGGPGKGVRVRFGVSSGGPVCT
jgi:hypothetical protein